MFNTFARYEQAFADWLRDRYPGVKAETYQYIDFLSDPADDQAPREGTLWAHQWDAFLRVVYSDEILGKSEIDEPQSCDAVSGVCETQVVAPVDCRRRYPT